MRLAVAVIVSLLPFTALAAEIPAGRGFCGEDMRLDADALRFEDGDCHFTKAVKSEAGWLVTTDCEMPNSILKVSIAGQTAKVTDQSGEPPITLARCP